jgi:hypothetical protein
MKSKYERKIAQKEYYYKNRIELIKRNILRYNNVISGRNNKTDTSFNYGKYIIVFK